MKGWEIKSQIAVGTEQGMLAGNVAVGMGSPKGAVSSCRVAAEPGDGTSGACSLQVVSFRIF